VNALEAILILLAAGILYGVLTSCQRQWGLNLLLVLCLLPPLLIAVEGTTEVITCDETYMVPEVADLPKSTFRQWQLGSFHTSMALIGSVVSGLKYQFAASDRQAKQLVKACHWLLGIAILAGMFRTISRHWIPKNRFPEYTLIYFYSGLLLPTNILSLKVANYDMLAMLLGLWGIICSFVAIEMVKRNSASPRQHVNRRQFWRWPLDETLYPDRGLTLVAVILTALAAQEKQIAAPFLALAVILSAVVRLRTRGRIDWWLPLQLGICTATVLLVVFATHGVVALWRPPNQPAFALASAVRPFLFPFEIVLRNAGIAQPSLSLEIGMAFLFVSVAACLIWRLNFARERMVLTFWYVLSLLLVFSFAVGAIGFYKIEAFLHPLYPIPNGNFVPRDEINGKIIHFLSSSQLEHTLRKIASAYSWFAISLPSAVVLVAFFALGSIIFKGRRESDTSRFGFQALGVVSLAMPLVYVLTNTPVGPRYFDVWVFGLATLIGILASDWLSLFASPLVRRVLLAAFCLLLLLEVLPFRPVVGTFWPWWANASALQSARTVELGKIAPVWSGWGEEAMIAGRRLSKMASAGQLPSKSFRLFTVYPGDWLPPDQTIKTDWAAITRDLGFTENDYYVVNRVAVVEGRFLVRTNPFLTIQYRGVPAVWVFRGSDLKDLY